MLHYFLILEFLQVSLGFLIVNERNDISCVNATCTTVKYQLTTNGSDYGFQIASRSSCNINNCNNCTYKGDWSLIQLFGKSYLSRTTWNCLMDSTRNISDLFPTLPSSISDVACSNYLCTKYKYSIYYPMFYTYSIGDCEFANCQTCSDVSKWTVNKTFSYSFLQRKSNKCYASTRINMFDFFVIETDSNIWTTMAPLDIYISTLNSYNFWNAGGIIAVIMSCLSFIALVIVLSVCFCGRNH